MGRAIGKKLPVQIIDPLFPYLHEVVRNMDSLRKYR
jgi:hypothetical protein